MESNHVTRIGHAPDATTLALWTSVHAYLPSIPLATLLRSPWPALMQCQCWANSAQIIHFRQRSPAQPMTAGSTTPTTTLQEIQ